MVIFHEEENQIQSKEDINRLRNQEIEKKFGKRPLVKAYKSDYRRKGMLAGGLVGFGASRVISHKLKNHLKNASLNDYIDPYGNKFTANEKINAGVNLVNTVYGPCLAGAGVTLGAIAGQALGSIKVARVKKKQYDYDKKVAEYKKAKGWN